MEKVEGVKEKNIDPIEELKTIEEDISDVVGALEKNCPDIPREVIEKLENAGDEAHQVIEVIHASRFSGPLPAPEILRQYELIVPDAAKTIIGWASAEGEHRRKIDNKLIDCDYALKSRAQWFGFIIAALAIIGGFVLILKGHAVSGMLLSGGALASIVGAFLYSAFKSEKKGAEESPD